MRALVVFAAVGLLAGCAVQTEVSAPPSATTPAPAPETGTGIDYPALVDAQFGECLDALGASDTPVYAGYNGSDVKGTITVAGGEFPLLFSTGKTGDGTLRIAPSDEATTNALIEQGCWTRPFGGG